ncbi:MAG: hypothetical protein V4729_04425 [Pseudomonadota bacterium]
MKTRFLARPRKAFAVALLLPALLIFAVGVAMAVAGFARFQAEAFLTHWAEKALPPEARAWQVAEAAAQRSVGWYPVANGEYLDRLGRVYSWQFYQFPYGAAVMLPALPPEQAVVVEHSRRQALDAYRASVAVRPAWPDSWARLAHAKLYLLQIDAEFGAAYARAAQLAFGRDEVNLELAEMGFFAWPSLTNGLREIALERGLRATDSGPRAARRVRQRAAQAGLVPQLCGRATPQQRMAISLCRQEEG